MDKGIWILALLGKVFRRGDDHVNGQHEFLANRQTNRVAAGVAAEEDDLFGIEAFGNQLGNGTNRGLVDIDFAHVQLNPFGRGSARYPQGLPTVVLEYCNGFCGQSEFAC